MKIPENPPDFFDVFKKHDEAIVKVSMDPMLSAFLTEEEREYNYWDKFKYLPMPNNISAEVMWACRELRNAGIRVQSPINNRNSGYFRYSIVSIISQTLHQIDRNVPFIIEDVPEGRGREAILIRSLMEEAIASSQIEGAAATRRKAKEMLASNKKPSNRAEQMILNNYKAINHLRELKDAPLSAEMLLELHRILTEKTFDNESEMGRFRQSPQDDNVEVIDSDGVVLYHPPSGDKIEPMLKELIDFANTDDKIFIHPLVKGILLHFWLAWIHPFCDGNGRTARALFYWYMLKKKYWAFEYLSISRIALHKEGQYKRAFLNSELSGDLTYFLLFNAQIINEAATEVAAYIKRKLAQENYGADIARKYPGLNPRQRALVLHAQDHQGQIYTIRRHQAKQNISYATARADIQGLVAAGLLIETGGAKTREFVPVLDLQQKLK